jgi:hypothetical protein
MKPIRCSLIVPHVGARLLAAAALCVVSMGQPAPSWAQQPRDTMMREGQMTIVSNPAGAQVAIRGSSELMGTSPLELGPEWIGKYVVSLSAPGYASAEGAFYFPPRGNPPYELSGNILLGSIHFPGVTALQSRRRERGIVLLAAGLGGLGAVVRDHLEYGSNKDKTDFTSQDRAEGFRYARDRWAIYTGAVWGMSAVDNVIRSRVKLLDASQTRLTIGAPKLNRSSVVWRSLLVPGAGQDYAAQRTRGFLWLGGTLLSGAAYLTAGESLHRIQTKLARADVLLAAAGPAEVADRQADVDHFTDLESRSSRLVDRLALTTLVIYVANVIDAGIVPLGGGSSGDKVSLSAPVGPRHAEIALHYNF